MDWTAAGTIVTALATGILAVVTWRYMQLTQVLVQESKVTREQSSMPVLSAMMKPMLPGQLSEHEIYIANDGNGVAIDVHVQVTLMNQDNSQYAFEPIDKLLGIVGLAGVRVNPAWVPRSDRPEDAIVQVDLTYTNLYGWRLQSSATLRPKMFPRSADWELLAQSIPKPLPPS